MTDDKNNKNVASSEPSDGAMPSSFLILDCEPNLAKRLLKVWDTWWRDAKVLK